jgi:hypothetical protein
MDLGEIERATEIGHGEAFRDLEICVSYDDPVCEFVLPLSPRKAADDGITPTVA